MYRSLCLIVLLLPWSFAAAQQTDQNPRLVLAHYMPWYVAPPAGGTWGWHWTMNHFDPEKVVDGRREIASHFYPLIGPYDSGDQHVLEYQLLLMKLAGIDGVIVDWYGRQDFRDYPILHRHTQQLLKQAMRIGVQFTICYEDQTIGALEKAGRITAPDRVKHAAGELQWLAENWFPLPGYVHLDGRPVLLSFGQSGLSSDEWTACLAATKTPIAYFSQHHKRPAAVGAFDWPLPKQGLSAIDRFNNQSRQWPHAIPVAFPRFVDIYAEAKVHESWGRIEDDRGQTFKTSLMQAVNQKTPLIQIATWNDWGEGTSIEPSVEFGYRDLERIQHMRRSYIDSQFAITASDLRLPAVLLGLRRKARQPVKELDRIALLLAAGDLNSARSALKSLE